MSSFQDKVCIITGGASGIGKALAARLAKAGAIVAVADIDGGGAAKVAAALGGRASAETVDVSQSASVQGLIDGVLARHGRIDYLFNNAGIGSVMELRDAPLAEWRRVLEINLFGVIHGVHAGYPVMIRQGFGHIVNTASGFGLAPGPMFGAYVTSKFAVVGLSEVLRQEAAALGVKVSVVCPGFIRTPILDCGAPSGIDTEAVLAKIPVKVIDADTAAARILDGVARNKGIIAFPFYVRLLTLLYRLAPRLYARMNARNLNAFRRLNAAKTHSRN